MASTRAKQPAPLREVGDPPARGGWSVEQHPKEILPGFGRPHCWEATARRGEQVRVISERTYEECRAKLLKLTQTKTQGAINASTEDDSGQDTGG